jgi:hypothetical protein
VICELVARKVTPLPLSIPSPLPPHAVATRLRRICNTARAARATHARQVLFRGLAVDMTAFNTQYAFLTASMAAFEADHDPDLMGASHATGPSLVRHWPVPGTALARPWYGTGPSLVRHTTPT